MLFLQLWLSDPPPPEEWFYPLVFPVLFAVAGCFCYFRGTQMESYGSKAPYRMLGIPLCVVALILGCLPAAKYYSDPLYQNIITSGRVKLAHQLGVVIGLGSLGSILFDRYRRAAQKRKEELYDRFKI